MQSLVQTIQVVHEFLIVVVALGEVLFYSSCVVLVFGFRYLIFIFIRLLHIEAYWSHILAIFLSNLDNLLYQLFITNLTTEFLILLTQQLQSLLQYLQSPLLHLTLSFLFTFLRTLSRTKIYRIPIFTFDLLISRRKKIYLGNEILISTHCLCFNCLLEEWCVVVVYVFVSWGEEATIFKVYFLFVLHCSLWIFTSWITSAIQDIGFNWGRVFASLAVIFVTARGFSVLFII